MKKIIFVLILAFPFNVFGQESFYKLSSKFYSLIDSSHKLKCCDSAFSGITLTYDIPLYEIPQSIVDLKEYEEQISNGDYLDFYAHNLADGYYNIKPSMRRKITKSCYKMSVDYKIHQDFTGESLYWVEGNLRIKIIFQSDDPNFCRPWWCKLLNNNWWNIRRFN
jgi:hypothetical protein